MKFLDRSVTALVLTAALGIGVGVSLPTAALAAPYQDRYPSPYSDLRALIDRTQSDLRAAADLEHGNEKQHHRYQSAQEHLSNIDRNLTKGHFDKGDFNHAIDDLKDILDHNTLQASSRDALQADLTDLKVARDRSY